MPGPTLPLDVADTPRQGRCPVCTTTHTLTPRGLIATHGPIGSRCPGAGRTPTRTAARLTDAARRTT